MSRTDDPLVLSFHVKAFAYANGATLALPSFELRRGDIVVLTGRSGSGKSTLLNLVSGVLALAAHQGSIKVGKTELAGANQNARDRLRPSSVGWMPQRAHVISALSVIDNVMLPIRFGDASIAPDTAMASAHALLTELEVASLANVRATQISVGQAARVCAARALVARPLLLCADEPSAALDAASAVVVARLFWRYVQEGGTALISSHDPAFIDALQSASSNSTSIRTLSLEAQ
jgi:putative ABC transport system ATP-binding protein